MSYQQTTQQEIESGNGVRIPPRLTDRINNRIEHTEFTTCEEYVVFVLEEVLRSAEESEIDTQSSRVDEAEVEDRLQSLGYLSND